MQEILIISNYYPPEKGAAANRIEQLALQLRDNNYNVTVISPLPNYPKGQVFDLYKGRFFVSEIINNINLKRLWIYPSVSKNVFVRLLSIMSFSGSLFFYLIFAKTPKKVVVQSPPLLLSFLSVFILSIQRKKIILNVSDLWPLAAIELNALKKNSFSHKVSLFMERFIYQKATIILGQSNEILNHIQLACPDKTCYLYRNLPKHEIVNLKLETHEDQTVRLFYAGLLGVAQGVFLLCNNINLKNLNFELHIFGDGAEKRQIQDLIRNSTQTKIYFHGMLERKELHERLKTMDIAIVPLKTRIYGSVPSKIFEYTALGFPVLYCGGGEGGAIVLENNLGWVAEVGDFNALDKQINEIAKLNKSQICARKIEVFETSKKIFNLDSQMQNLLKQNVF